MSIQRQTVVVIDPISSGRRYGQDIRHKGYHAVALLTRKRFPGRLQRLHAVDGFDEVVYVESLEQAKTCLTGRAVRAVIPGSDSALRISDRLAAHLGLAGNPVPTCLARMNKFEMKRRLQEEGVPVTPAFRLSLDDLVEGYDSGIAFPVVIKPSQGTGAENVKICQSRSDLYKALAAIESNVDAGSEDEKHALVEAYVEGPEYFIVTANLGAVGRQILCFAEYEKIRIGDHPSIYRNIRSISPISAQAHQAFIYTSQVNSAIEANIGINDIEFKINPAGHFIIEQNGRLPGANVPALIELCTGLNCYDLNIDIYLGHAPLRLPVPRYDKHFCICCLISEQGGTVTGFEGVALIKDLESFHDLGFLVRRGEVIEATRDFLSTWGFVYLVHEDCDLLRRQAEIVHENLKLTLA
ncbi:ATP-grasp domain-containing protein [Pseudomonas putida]|uniref:Biotin carboxylase-like protein n=1 Tax=Pseudomonas putida (strain ATCC 700007 / DSM 6899 / JCM 31910 / BCRC 17059 / LMG 24140 / F1) TaxID=351746 RepID=A5VYW3_PSEP1|nr:MULTISPECIES: ATP-grasp domain-containing protein [Pseudomonas]EKT4567000.1 ATP-grasp domain-containing protein [Pseudomonas putida]MCE1054177.1 ATP-grasp domain-containing protein [Pseudomonas alloputida]MDD1999543.1 ATP-grasp domain-containing protein [Pseudomonas putida]MPS99843.1 ATP-grasp domain-containing protein [Pseudomonas sp.]QUG88055.1 ATP-grasp domain-containing protein [Pseudomonas putida]